MTPSRRRSLPRRHVRTATTRVEFNCTRSGRKDTVGSGQIETKFLPLSGYEDVGRGRPQCRYALSVGSSRGRGSRRSVMKSADPSQTKLKVTRRGNPVLWSSPVEFVYKYPPDIPRPRVCLSINNPNIPSTHILQTCLLVRQFSLFKPIPISHIAGVVHRKPHNVIRHRRSYPLTSSKFQILSHACFKFGHIQEYADRLRSSHLTKCATTTNTR